METNATPLDPPLLQIYNSNHYFTNYYVSYNIEKPAYHMFKNDVDWAPSLHLGHDKLGPEEVKVNKKEIGERKQRREGEKKWSRK